MADCPDEKHLVEVKLGSEELFKGKLLHAWRDTVKLPDGGVATREYIVHPGAVVIVPLLDDGRVLLERQFRYPMGRVMIEFPAGKLDVPGEDKLACAKRELLEETGYTATEWAHAGELHPVIAYSTECIDIWFARGLVDGGRRSLDQGEHLDVFTATPQELLRWCCEGKVTDAKTLSCVLWLHNILSGSWQLEWRT